MSPHFRILSPCPLPVPITVTEIARRRLLRIGAVPVLEVTVIYPCLTWEAEAASAMSRFNAAYETMAEAFLEWADQVPYAQATEAYAALGPRAAYRFDRRLLVCAMKAEPLTSADKRLTVYRTVTYTSRRGEMGTVSREGRDVWRLPSLTLCGGR